MFAGAASSCKKEDPGPPERVVFSDTIQWEWELEQWYGGNAFYWWHRTQEGVSDLGEMPGDWTSPRNFYRGRFHFRLEVLEQPGAHPFRVQFGIWQDREKEGGHSETIASGLLMEGGTGSLGTEDLGSPSEWWNRRKDAPVDFSRPEDYYMMGLALWSQDPDCIPMGQGWNNSNACSDPEGSAAMFFPMKARVTVVAVASGHEFSGWENY